MIKVAVVDDHDMVRKGLISYLQTERDIELVFEATCGQEAIDLALKKKPDVVLMDLLMERGNGIEATKGILEKYPGCKIIIITSFYDEAQVIPAIEAGAFSYLLKTASAHEIVLAIRKAAAGETVIEPKVASVMLKKLRPAEKKPHDDLTEREFEVLMCLGEGMTNQEISEELYIGVKTVKTHVSNILAKLGVSDRTQAAVYANRNGVIKKRS